MKKLITLLIILSFCMLTKAQKKYIIRGDCGTPAPAVDVLRLPGLSHQSHRLAAASQLFKVYVHIYRNDNGSNAACTLQQIEDEVRNFMNPDYSGANTCFAIVGYEFINNTHINTNCNVDVAADQQLMFANDRSDCINIYCHQSGLVNFDQSAPGGLGSLNGSAYDIPSNHVSINIGNGVLSGVRTLAHETGHALGLYHTFQNGPGFGDELVNGSLTNRRTTGDKVADTEADPYPSKYKDVPQISFGPNCIFTGTARDANNDAYHPPVRNTMSYYHHFAGNGCQRNQLTPGQFARIDSVTDVTPFLLNAVAPAYLSLTNASFTSGEQRTAALYSISVGNFSGNDYNISVSHNALIRSALITLSPGSIIKPSAGGLVNFVPTTCQ